MARRIGILGGSFNPPTLGHLQMAIETINMNIVDEVWMVPCGTRQDKQYSTTNQQRLTMTQILIDGMTDEFRKVIKCDSTEIDHGTMIPTGQLMSGFMEVHPDKQFFFILGSDLLPGLKYWDEQGLFCQQVNFIVFQRSMAEIDPQHLPTHYILVNSQFTASSSTEVRQRLEQVKSHKDYDRLFGVIPLEIIQYIQTHGLYHAP